MLGGRRVPPACARDEIFEKFDPTNPAHMDIGQDEAVAFGGICAPEDQPLSADLSDIQRELPWI